MLVLTAKRLHQLREALVALDEVLVFALCRDSAILEGVDVVALREEMQRMGDEDDGLATVAKRTDDSVCEQGAADMGVDYTGKARSAEEYGIRRSYLPAERGSSNRTMSAS